MSYLSVVGGVWCRKRWKRTCCDEWKGDGGKATEETCSQERRVGASHRSTRWGKGPERKELLTAPKKAQLFNFFFISTVPDPDLHTSEEEEIFAQ